MNFTCHQCGRTSNGPEDLAGNDCPECHFWWDVRDPPMHFDRQGNPISLARWCELLEDDDYKRIAATQVGDFWISTVWLGLNHAWGFGHDIPIIFETMVFGPDGKGLEQERYTSEEAAVDGHERMVAHIQTISEIEHWGVNQWPD